jgi:flagellar basal-body rod protein FlgB
MSGGLLELLTKKMSYLTQRQTVIADNVANANTPGFKPKDLVSFSEALNQAGGTGGGLKMEVTSGMHLGGTHGVSGPYKTETEKDPYEVKPSGNAVVLEQQMSELAKNYTDYSLVTGLYHATASLLKTALSRPS